MSFWISSSEIAKRKKRKTTKGVFDTDANDVQFVRRRCPTEFLDPDIGLSSVGNPRSEALSEA